MALPRAFLGNTRRRIALATGVPVQLIEDGMESHRDVIGESVITIFNTDILYLPHDLYGRRVAPRGCISICFSINRTRIC